MVVVVMTVARESPHDLCRHTAWTQFIPQAATRRPRHVTIRRQRAQRQCRQGDDKQDLPVLYGDTHLPRIVAACTTRGMGSFPQNSAAQCFFDHP